MLLSEYACMFVYTFSVSWESVVIVSVPQHREENAKHTGCLEPDRFPLRAHRGN